jgi:hypothetical protein
MPIDRLSRPCLEVVKVTDEFDRTEANAPCTQAQFDVKVTDGSGPNESSSVLIERINACAGGRV